METKLTEDWLLATGFKWSQEERQPSKHWTLWFGQAIHDPTGYRNQSADDLGIEIAHGGHDTDWWYCWLRSDLAGRYSRFLHLRHLTTIEQVIQILEALTGREWQPENVIYGQYWSPDAADRIRRDRERLDWRMAEQAAQRRGDDDTKSRRVVS